MEQIEYFARKNLKYSEDFEHFDYVNPDAPKGGEIALGTVGTFDSMHPYTRKGRAGALSSSIYESLLGSGVNGTAAPADVYGEYYGLLAERLEYDDDKNWVIFYMRSNHLHQVVDKLWLRLCFSPLELKLEMQ